MVTPQIALEQIRWACEVGLPGSMALLDAGYGNDSKLRAGITDLGKYYVAGIQPQMLVWKPGKRPGRAPKKRHRDEPDTISVKDISLGLRKSAWRTIQWREGSNEWLSSRFARLRVHVASRHERASEPTKEWLLSQQRDAHNINLCRSSTTPSLTCGSLPAFLYRPLAKSLLDCASPPVRNPGAKTVAEHETKPNQDSCVRQHRKFPRAT